MTFLANYYNMTVFHYNTPRIPEGRQYMLEINPHYTIRGMDDKLNVIDGRWVDMYSGLFIDITTARKQDTPEGSEKNVILYNKDGHKYKVCSLSLGKETCGLLTDKLLGERYISSERYILRRCASQDTVLIRRSASI